MSTSKKQKVSWGLRPLQANSSRAWKYPSNNEQKAGNNCNRNPEKQENILLIPTLNPFVFQDWELPCYCLLNLIFSPPPSNFLLNWLIRELIPSTIIQDYRSPTPNQGIHFVLGSMQSQITYFHTNPIKALESRRWLA